MIVARKTKELDFEEEMRQTFKKFGLDNSGSISTNALRKVMATLDETLIGQQIDEMMMEADKDGNETIDCQLPPSPMLR